MLEALGLTAAIIVLLAFAAAFGHDYALWRLTRSPVGTFAYRGRRYAIEDVTEAVPPAQGVVRMRRETRRGH